MKSVIISIGDELTSGSSLDTNSAWLADRMTLIGVDVMRHETIGDDESAIAACLRSAGDDAEWVLVTGGLGPTEDDRTRHALASAMGAPLEFDSQSWSDIQAFFTWVGRAVSPSNRAQAERPAGSRAIPNRWGTAPGIEAAVGRSRTFVMPGVPREMTNMFEEHVEPRIRATIAGRKKVRAQLHCIGMSEAQIGEQISPYMKSGRNPAVGTRAADGIITIRITATGGGASEAEKLAGDDVAAIRALMGPVCFGADADTLASVVGRLLRERGATVATAESCTGGMLGAALTAVAGSSEYFVGGYLTYSNELKSRLLGVSEETLSSEGAVSEAVARDMAGGARRGTGADFALSITGVAGPGGGSELKPVGTVCIGLADSADCTARTLHFPAALGREGIRLRSVQSALDILRKRLLLDGTAC